MARAKARARRVIQRAEAEFGEPFEEIIRGFAAMGYSRQDTSHALGWRDHTAVQRWMDRNGVSIEFLPGHHTDAFRERMSHGR